MSERSEVREVMQHDMEVLVGCVRTEDILRVGEQMED